MNRKNRRSKTRVGGVLSANAQQRIAEISGPIWESYASLVQRLEASDQENVRLKQEIADIKALPPPPPPLALAPQPVTVVSYPNADQIVALSNQIDLKTLELNRLVSTLDENSNQSFKQWKAQWSTAQNDLRAALQTLSTKLDSHAQETNAMLVALQNSVNQLPKEHAHPLLDKELKQLNASNNVILGAVNVSSDKITQLSGSVEQLSARLNAFTNNTNNTNANGPTIDEKAVTELASGLRRITVSLETWQKNAEAQSSRLSQLITAVQNDVQSQFDAMQTTQAQYQSKIERAIEQLSRDPSAKNFDRLEQVVAQQAKLQTDGLGDLADVFKALQTTTEEALDREAKQQVKWEEWKQTESKRWYNQTIEAPVVQCRPDPDLVQSMEKMHARTEKQITDLLVRQKNDLETAFEGSVQQTATAQRQAINDLKDRSIQENAKFQRQTIEELRKVEILVSEQLKEFGTTISKGYQAQNNNSSNLFDVLETLNRSVERLNREADASRDRLQLLYNQGTLNNPANVKAALNLTESKSGGGGTRGDGRSGLAGHGLRQQNHRSSRLLLLL